MPQDVKLVVGLTPDTSQAQSAMNALGGQAAAGFNQAFSKGINPSLFTRPLGTITGKASEFQKSMEASNARVLAFGASAGAIFLVKSAFEKLVSTTVTVQKSLAEINSLFRLGGGDLQNFSNSLYAIANKTSVSFNEAAEAALVFAHHGLDMEETLKRTTAALSLSRISGMSYAESVATITSAINQFTKESMDAIDVTNKLAALSGRFAASENEIAEALQRVGASASEANVSFNETISLIAAAQQATQRGGSVIGNAFSTIFTRLQRPQVLDQLEAAGVAVRDLQGRTLPLMQVLGNLANTYDTLSSAQKSFVTEAVGGVRQVNTLKATLQDLGNGTSVVSNAMAAASDATGSMEKRMNILNATISGQLIRTMNELSRASSNIGNNLFSGSASSGLSSIGKAFSQIANFTDSSKAESGSAGEKLGANIGIGIIKGVGNVVSGIGLQFITTIGVKLLNNLAKFVGESIRDIGGFNSELVKTKSLEAGITSFLQQNPKLLQDYISGLITRQELEEKFLKTLQEENAVRNILNQTVSGVAGGVSSRVSSGKSGSVLNLFSPVAEALRKEDIATHGHAKLSAHPSLRTPDNPMGLAAIDSRNQRNAAEAIQQHLMFGQNMTEIKYSGTTSVPNLDASSMFVTSMMLGIFQASKGAGSSTFSDKYALRYPKLFSAMDKEAAAREAIIKQYNDLREALLQGKAAVVDFQGKTSTTAVEFEKTHAAYINPIAESVSQTRKNRESERDRLQHVGWTRALVSDFAFAGLSQGISGSTNKEAINALGQSSSMAFQSMYAMPGKVGTSIGAGFAVSGFFNALNILKNGIAKSKEEYDLQASKSEKLVSQIDRLVQSIGKFDEMVVDAHVTTENLSKEQRVYMETLAAMSQTPRGKELAAKLSGASDNQQRTAILEQARTEETKTLNSQEAKLQLQEYGANRTFSVPFAGKFGNPVGYSTDVERGQIEESIQNSASTQIAGFSDEFKDALLSSVGSLDEFNKTIKESQDKQGTAGAFRQYIGGLNPNTSGAITTQIRYNLAQEEAYKNPAIAAARDRLISQNYERQLAVDNASREAIGTQRKFINQGALLGGNILDQREIQNRGEYFSGQLGITQLQQAAKLGQLQYGSTTQAYQQYQIGSRQVESERQKNINAVSTETIRGIVGNYAQNFEANLSQGGLGAEGGISSLQNPQQLSQLKLSRISALNQGLAAAVSQTGNGPFDLEKFNQSVVKNAPEGMQQFVKDYLNSSSYQLNELSKLNETSNKIAEINQSAKQENAQKLEELHGELAKINFERQSSLLGGKDILTDPQSQRKMDREITMGLSLMKNSKNDIGRTRGAAMFLNSLNQQHIPLDKNNPLIAEAFAIGEQSLTGLIGKREGRIEKSASRFLNPTESAGLDQLFYGGSTNAQSAKAIFQSFKPEDQGVINTATSETDKETSKLNVAFDTASQDVTNFGAKLIATADELQKKIDSLQTIKKQSESAGKIETEQLRGLLEGEIKRLNAEKFTPKQGTNYASVAQTGIQIATSAATLAVLVATAGKGIKGILGGKAAEGEAKSFFTPLKKWASAFGGKPVSPEEALSPRYKAPQEYLDWKSKQVQFPTPSSVGEWGPIAEKPKFVMPSLGQIEWTKNPRIPKPVTPTNIPSETLEKMKEIQAKFAASQGKSSNISPEDIQNIKNSLDRGMEMSPEELNKPFVHGKNKLTPRQLEQAGILKIGDVKPFNPGQTKISPGLGGGKHLVTFIKEPSTRYQDYVNKKGLYSFDKVDPVDDINYAIEPSKENSLIDSFIKKNKRKLLPESTPSTLQKAREESIQESIRRVKETEKPVPSRIFNLPLNAERGELEAKKPGQLDVDFGKVESERFNEQIGVKAQTTREINAHLREKAAADAARQVHLSGLPATKRPWLEKVRLGKLGKIGGALALGIGVYSAITGTAQAAENLGSPENKTTGDKLNAGLDFTSNVIGAGALFAPKLFEKGVGKLGRFGQEFSGKGSRFLNSGWSTLGLNIGASFIPGAEDTRNNGGVKALESAASIASFIPAGKLAYAGVKVGEGIDNALYSKYIAPNNRTTSRNDAQYNQLLNDNSDLATIQELKRKISGIQQNHRGNYEGAITEYQRQIQDIQKNHVSGSDYAKKEETDKKQDEYLQKIVDLLSRSEKENAITSLPPINLHVSFDNIDSLDSSIMQTVEDVIKASLGPLKANVSRLQSPNAPAQVSYAG